MDERKTIKVARGESFIHHIGVDRVTAASRLSAVSIRAIHVSPVELCAAAVDRVVQVSSAEVGESAKLLENIFRAVNIALVNELQVVLDRMGINIWEVIEAAKADQSIDASLRRGQNCSCVEFSEAQRQRLARPDTRPLIQRGHRGRSRVATFEIIEMLRHRGAIVSYCDPYVPERKKTRKHDLELKSVSCTVEEFASHDVVVRTAHRQFP